MIQCCRGLGFPFEAFEKRGILGSRLRQNFECHLPVEFRLNALVNRTHSALSYLPDQRVTAKLQEGQDPILRDLGDRFALRAFDLFVRELIADLQRLTALCVTAHHLDGHRFSLEGSSGTEGGVGEFSSDLAFDKP